jgi:hypothetical protein
VVCLLVFVHGCVVLTRGSLDHGLSVSIDLTGRVVLLDFACVLFLLGWLDVMDSDWLVRSNRGGLRHCLLRLDAAGMGSRGACWLLPLCESRALDTAPSGAILLLFILRFDRPS